MLLLLSKKTSNDYRFSSAHDLRKSLRSREQGPARTFLSRELLHSFSRLTCCTAELASWALICWFVPCENKDAVQWASVIPGAEGPTGDLNPAPNTKGGDIHIRGTGLPEPYQGHAQRPCSAVSESETRHCNSMLSSSCSLLLKLLSNAFLSTFILVTSRN